MVKQYQYQLDVFNFKGSFFSFYLMSELDNLSLEINDRDQWDRDKRESMRKITDCLGITAEINPTSLNCKYSFVLHKIDRDPPTPMDRELSKELLRFNYLSL